MPKVGGYQKIQFNYKDFEVLIADCALDKIQMHNSESVDTMMSIRIAKKYIELAANDYEIK